MRNTLPLAVLLAGAVSCAPIAKYAPGKSAQEAFVAHALSDGTLVRNNVS